MSACKGGCAHCRAEPLRRSWQGAGSPCAATQCSAYACRLQGHHCGRLCVPCLFTPPRAWSLAWDHGRAAADQATARAQNAAVERDGRRVGALTLLAERTEGYSGSDLHDLCALAAQQPIHRYMEERSCVPAAARPAPCRPRALRGPARVLSDGLGGAKTFRAHTLHPTRKAS